MSRCKRFLCCLTPFLALGLLTLAGCSGSTSKKKRAADDDEGPGVAEKGGGGSSGGAVAGAEGGEVAIKEYSGTLKGRVVFSGDANNAKFVSKPPDKNQAECPAQIPQAGWYAGGADGKGVRYAVVFLRPVGGAWKNLDKKVLDLRGGTEGKAGPELVDVYQPKCQFDPRVSVVLPGQKLRGHNNSNPPISHDFMLQAGSDRYGGTVPAGNHSDLTLPGDDRKPYTVFCNQHTNFMNGYVWSFKHPFAAVTNENGEFTINNVPVLGSGKMERVVWHEMLKTERNMKVIGEVTVGSKEEKKQDIVVP